MEKTVDKKDKFNSKEKNSGFKRRDGHREDGFYRKDDKRKPASQTDAFKKKPENQSEETKKREFFLENDESSLEKDSETKERNGENRKIPRPRKNVEMKICGIHACKMVFEKRSQDIIRVYLTEENIKDFNKILKFCVDNKLAYRVLNNEELIKVSESNHHEGVCFLIKKAPSQSFQDYLKEQTSTSKTSCVVALENVQNPHNLGAIMRVCANFGVNAILVSNTEAALSGSAYRTSEGGAEFIKVITTDNFEKAVQAFRTNDYKILTTSSHTGKSIYEEKLPEKMLVIFGSEGTGITTPLMRSGDKTVKIPSTGNVESLNIACAASVILAEHWRGNKK
jgi:RNA methyltransferase, TrmH family